jgi:hypothetical protein
MPPVLAFRPMPLDRPRPNPIRFAMVERRSLYAGAISGCSRANSTLIKSAGLGLAVKLGLGQEADFRFRVETLATSPVLQNFAGLSSVLMVFGSAAWGDPRRIRQRRELAS